MKDTFVFRIENRAGIERMDDKDAGVLFKAILAHAAGDAVNIDLLPPTAQVLYPMIEAQIDKANDAYRATCERNSENGKKGGRPKKTERLNKKPNETHKNQPLFSETDEKHSDSDYEYDSGSESPNGDIKEKPPTGAKRKAASFADLFADTPDLAQDFVKEAWDDWIEVRKKFPFTDRAATLNANALKKCSRGDPIRAVKILEKAVEHGWRGLYDLDDETKQKQKKNGLDWDSVVV